MRGGPAGSNPLGGKSQTGLLAGEVEHGGFKAHQVLCLTWVTRVSWVTLVTRVAWMFPGSERAGYFSMTLCL